MKRRKKDKVLIHDEDGALFIEKPDHAQGCLTKAPSVLPPDCPACNYAYHVEGLKAHYRPELPDQADEVEGNGHGHI